MASNPANLAREAYRNGNYRLAERLFRSLCEREPENPVWHLELATLFITLIRFEEADSALQTAARTGSESVETLCQVAACYFSMYRADDAHRLLEPAAAAGHLPSVVGLAQMLERVGEIDQASAIVEEALSAQSEHSELRLLRVQLLQRQRSLEAAEAEARDLLGAAISSEIQRRTAYLLAGILDKTERYCDAARLLADTKQAARADPAVNQLRKDFRKRMALARELSSTFSAKQWEQWAATSESHALRFRPSLLCGHPRSGTTLLEGQIERFEEVVSFDETGAFDGGALSSAGLVGRPKLLRALKPNGDDLAMSARRHYARSIASLYGKPLTERPLVLDKNPSQLIRLALWLRLLPELRILVALRDPRDVVVSSYFFDLPTNATSVQFLDWESTARHYVALMDIWLGLRDRLPGELWAESRYEDLVANSAGEAGRVADFLKVEPERRSGDESPSIRHSPNYATADQPVHSRSVGRWTNYEEYIQPCANLLLPFLRAFSYL